jgi:hypothetical protein
MKKHKIINNFSSELNSLENKKLFEEMSDKIIKTLDNVNDDKTKIIVIESDIDLPANIYLSIKAMISPFILN